MKSGIGLSVLYQHMRMHHSRCRCNSLIAEREYKTLIFGLLSLPVVTHSALMLVFKLERLWLSSDQTSKRVEVFVPAFYQLVLYVSYSLSLPDKAIYPWWCSSWNMAQTRLWSMARAAAASIWPPSSATPPSWPTLLPKDRYERRRRAKAKA